MNSPDPTPAPDTDPASEAAILAAFAAVQAAEAKVSPAGESLRAKAERITELTSLINGEGPVPSDARAQVCDLLKSLAWPAINEDGTVTDQPLMLTLAKEDLIQRLWQQDGAGTETERTWLTNSKIVLYVAAHSQKTFCYFYTSLTAQLLAVYTWIDQQITDYGRRDLMEAVAWALWSGHRVNMAAPAAAPYGTQISGN